MSVYLVNDERTNSVPIGGSHRLVLEQSHLPTHYVLELRAIRTRVLEYTL